MKRFRMRRIWLFGLIIFITVGALIWNSDTMTDQRVWSQYRQELTAEQVSSMDVHFESMGADSWVPLSDEEKVLVLAMLRDGLFVRTNRDLAGPDTSPRVLKLNKKQDGNWDGFWEYGEGQYIVAPHHIDAQTQFIIRSSEVEHWLQQKEASLKKSKST